MKYVVSARWRSETKNLQSSYLQKLKFKEKTRFYKNYLCEEVWGCSRGAVSIAQFRKPF